MRNRMLRRVLQLLRLLQDRCTLAELARACQVTTRTIRRDLAVIAAAGLPLKRQPREGAATVYWLTPGSCPICYPEPTE